MNRASGSFDSTAARIARTGQSPTSAPGASTSAGAATDNLSLSSSMVLLLEARNSFEANANTVAVGDRMTQATLNMIG